MRDEYDHTSTDEVVCPYCGYIHMDSFDFPDSFEDYACDNCGEKFDMQREYTVEYTTYKTAMEKVK